MKRTKHGLRHRRFTNPNSEIIAGFSSQTMYFKEIIAPSLVFLFGAWSFVRRDLFYKNSIACGQATSVTSLTALVTGLFAHPPGWEAILITVTKKIILII